LLRHRALSLAWARPRRKTRRALAAADVELDRLVYELYEPTDEEIKIAEEATRE
jgi:hypothetical protein